MNTFTRIIAALIPLGVGGLAGVATVTGINNWYVYLEKPVFNPPNWVFGPVWSLLYLLMGVTIYRLLSKPKSGERSQAITVFWVQLILNGAWSFIFFNAHQLGWAFAEILLIWLAIIWMIISTHRVDKTAAYIQIPYLLWVSFASVLNGTLWWMNH